MTAKTDATPTNARLKRYLTIQKGAQGPSARELALSRKPRVERPDGERVRQFARIEREPEDI